MKRSWILLNLRRVFFGAIAGVVAAFGADHPASAQNSPELSNAAASAIVTPLYDALTASSPDVIERLLGQVTSADWQNCGANDICQSRADVIKRWTGRISIIPNLRWEQKELLISGSHITVRGEDTGTPAMPFLGIQPNGRSFRITTIDIHEVKDGKIVRTYHVEDWASAIRQLSAS